MMHDLNTQQAQHNDAVKTDAQINKEDMLNRIGQVTRTLHENIGALGLDKILAQVATEIPDTRDRLNYVTKMTEQAAERVLNATDEANPLLTEIASETIRLQARWATILAKPALKSEYDQLVEETLNYFTLTEKNANASKDLLMEIMMAQDFQDLTGQVIKKIIGIAQDLERELLQVLVDYSPTTKKEDNSLMNGPQINSHKTTNIVASQEQVDDLLESLGF